MLKIGFVMDPIQDIHPQKDTTLALMLEAQALGHTIYYITPQDIWLEQNIVQAKMHSLTVADHDQNWFDFKSHTQQSLSTLDCIFLRKDPPFNMEYIYLTYLLELAEQQGVLVINKPRSVRDANEKLFTGWFPQCCPPTCVSSQASVLLSFLQRHPHCILKPLDSMGGNGISIVQLSDTDPQQHLEQATKQGHKTMMLQQYLPQIKDGDKRIMLINGEAYPLGLARIPTDDFRGNLNAGATGKVFELSERDRWLASQVGPTLKQKGLAIVGIDVIGDYITEINVTSPTCVREISAQASTSLLKPLFEWMSTQCHG